MLLSELLSLAATGRKERQEFSTYYDRPVVKRPHWVWQIWLYFWLGGIGAGCSIIGLLAEIFGDRRKTQPIVRAGRYISMATGMASPVLLILDLGRPERFLNMLRIIKLRSPLSVGTYIMSANGFFGNFAVARQLVADGVIPERSPLAKLINLVPNPLADGMQGITSFAMGSYTGVLLSSTAVPLWSEASEILPPLFLSSGLSNASASLQLFLLLNGVGEEQADYKALESIETAAILAELGLLFAAHRKMGALLTRPLTQGRIGRLFLGGAVGMGMVAPLLLQPLGRARWLRALSALATLSGGLIFRYCIIEGGKLSADDPQAYHSVTSR